MTVPKKLDEHAKAWVGGCRFIPAALTGAAITGDVLTARPPFHFHKKRGATQ